MHGTSKSNQKAQSAGMGAYCSAFRTSPKPMNHSWLAPVVAPVMGGAVAEPSEYRFASRAHGVRRSPPASTKRSTATNNPTAHHGQPQAPYTNGMQSTSSSTHQQQQHSRDQRSYDPDDRYDEFLATFQHRIDGMTGQRGGWGF